MVCVDGMVRETHSIGYDTFAVWFRGTVCRGYNVWLNLPGGRVCFSE